MLLLFAAYGWTHTKSEKRSEQWKHDVRATANWIVHVIPQVFIRFIIISLLACMPPKEYHLDEAGCTLWAKSGAK